MDEIIEAGWVAKGFLTKESVNFDEILCNIRSLIMASNLPPCGQTKAIRRVLRCSRRKVIWVEQPCYSTDGIPIKQCNFYKVL